MFARVLLLCVVSLSWTPRAFSRDPLVRAALSGNYIFACPIAASDWSEPVWHIADKRLALYTCDIQKPLAKSIALSSLVLEDTWSISIMHRWHAANGRVYAFQYTSDLFSVRDAQEARKQVVSIRLPDLSRLGMAHVNDAGRRANVEIDTPILSRISIPMPASSVHNARFAVKPRIYFDFLPDVNGNYELFTVVPAAVGYQLVKSTSNSQNKGGEVRWVEAEKWVAEFCVPFFATASKDERFLVTETGQVYLPARKAQIVQQNMNPVALKKVWAGLPPVDALIHDADNAKWYAFTKDSYFELADPIRPKPHAIRVQRPKTAEDSLTTAAACGRVIRGLPEPKKK